MKILKAFHVSSESPSNIDSMPSHESDLTALLLVGRTDHEPRWAAWRLPVLLLGTETYVPTTSHSKWSQIPPLHCFTSPITMEHYALASHEPREPHTRASGPSHHSTGPPGAPLARRGPDSRHRKATGCERADSGRLSGTPGRADRRVYGERDRRGGTPAAGPTGGDTR